MPTWLIVVLVIVALLLLLAVGGALAGAERRRRREPRFDEQLEGANRALAAARASDRGWDRDALEAAARGALARERPGLAVSELILAQVLDRPGTEEDKAMFRALHPGGETRVTLGRVGGQWTAEAVQDQG
jgi:type II secretory pathway pseudopilin PulG